MVRYGLMAGTREVPDSFQTAKNLDVGPGKKGELAGVVEAKHYTIDVSPEGKTIRPLSLAVTVTTDQDKGAPLGKANYVFRMIWPAQYMSTLAEFDPDLRVVLLYVTHLASDPVTGPVNVQASIGGAAYPERLVPRSKIMWYQFPVSPRTASIKWQAGVEWMFPAFSGTVETPVPPPPPAAAPPAAAPPG